MRADLPMPVRGIGDGTGVNEAGGPRGCTMSGNRSGSPLHGPSRPGRRRALVAPLACLGWMGGCDGRRAGVAADAIVFRHPRLFGDPGPIDALMRVFARETGVRVRRETLPASSDEQHLFYAINLQARAAVFDVLALDVVWLAEFARAGWLRDLTASAEPDGLADVFPGALRAARWQDRLYGMPWFVDAGVLYYREDLLRTRGIQPPDTWESLIAAARTVSSRETNVHGFVWQGKQYEGLVCNVLEHVWSHGGTLPAEDAKARRGALEGLALTRRLVTSGASPAMVTTLTEEPARIAFARGRAAFMRNWPYAWKLLQQEGSSVRGRVAVAPLPHGPGGASAAALGGWLLGVNAYCTRPADAERLVRFLGSAPAQKALALAYGYSPPRRSLYADTDLIAAQPFLAALQGIFESARPRPVSSRYVAASQTLQAEFSGVLVGTRSPDEALENAGRALSGERGW